MTKTFAVNVSGYMDELAYRETQRIKANLGFPATRALDDSRIIDLMAGVYCWRITIVDWCSGEHYVEIEHLRGPAYTQKAHSRVVRSTDVNNCFYAVRTMLHAKQKHGTEVSSDPIAALFDSLMENLTCPDMLNTLNVGLQSRG